MGGIFLDQKSYMNVNFTLHKYNFIWYPAMARLQCVGQGSIQLLWQSREVVAHTLWPAKPRKYLPYGSSEKKKSSDPVQEYRYLSSHFGSWKPNPELRSRGLSTVTAGLTIITRKIFPYVMLAWYPMYFQRQEWKSLKMWGDGADSQQSGIM